MTVHDLHIGFFRKGVGEYDLNPGTEENLNILEITDDLVVGAHGKGTFNQKAYTQVSVADEFSVADGFEKDQDFTSTYTMDGGELTAGLANIGEEAKGLFVHNQGTVEITEDLVLGRDATGDGKYMLNPGTEENLNILEISDDLVVGDFGKGTFVQKAHTQVSVADEFSVADGFEEDQDFTSTYTMDGGSLTAKLANIGEEAKGLFVHNHGSVEITETLTLGRDATGEGKYTLVAGAALVAEKLDIAPAGTGEFVQSGGTLQVTTIENRGTFEASGGTTLTDSFTNHAQMTIAGDWQLASIPIVGVTRASRSATH